MNQRDAINIAGFDDGKGAPLDIKKTPPNNNSPAQGNNNHQTSSTVALKVLGYIGLLASIAFLITAAVVSPWYAIGGGVGLLLFLVCVGGAAIKDYNNSTIQATPTDPALNNTHTLDTSIAKDSAVSLEDGISNRMAKYNKDDYYKNPDISNKIAR